MPKPSDLFQSVVWQSPESSIDLSEKQIHVWQLPIHFNEAQLQQMSSCLSASELQRSLQLINPIHQQERIAARALLRIILSHYLTIAPSHIQYHFGERGKPFLDSEMMHSHSDIMFNASDSGDSLLIALAHGIEVGIDTEALPRTVNVKGLYRKKLSQNEQHYFDSLDEQLTNEAAIVLWTRKEAYGKAIGRGIYYPMSEADCLSETKATFHIDTHHHSKNADNLPGQWQGISFSNDARISTLIYPLAETHVQIKYFKPSSDALNDIINRALND